MKIKPLSKQPLFYSLIIVLVALGLIISSYVFGWNTPSVDAPGGNLPAPLNVGSETQTKEGGLIIEGPLRLGLLSSSQRDNLSPATGTLFYNTTENKIQLYTSGQWKNVGAKLALGQTCSLDGDCDSTHCIDGVCCSTTCDGGCAACNISGHVGTCTIRPADDTTENPPACQRCDGTHADFQPQTGDDGYLCSDGCSRCTSGSCVIRSADDTTENPPACQRCDGTHATFQAQTADDGYNCNDICSKCDAGVCEARAADDTTESPPVCQRCDGTSMTPVNVADNTQATGCTDTCKKCYNGSCVSEDGEDLFNQCDNTTCIAGACKGYCDNDSDGHYAKVSSSSCTTNEGATSAGDDCDDSCDTCYPGSTAYTTSKDGLDQDCDGTADNATDEHYYLFITASTYDGDLGDRSDADDKCNTDSNKPSDFTGDAWAFISVNSDDEIQDMPTTKNVNTNTPWYWYYNGTTKLAANDWSDLLDGSIANSASSAGYDTGKYYKTGSKSTGEVDDYTCSGWTTNSDYQDQTLGISDATDGDWLAKAAYYCSWYYPILCAENMTRYH